MPYLWEPTPQGVGTILTELQPHRYDPDRYWPLLVGMVHDQFILALAEHREDCDNATCRTCMNLARLDTTLEAHNAIQPGGCACDDHRVFPHRLQLGIFKTPLH